MKIKSRLLGINLAIATLLMSGCATQTKLTYEQISSQYPQITSLQSDLQKSRAQGAELLSPENYSNASALLQGAISAAEDNESNTAMTKATAGLKIIPQLNRNVENSRNILADVLAARESALSAGVMTLQSQQLAEMDNDLRKTGSLVEEGNIEKAKQRRPKLLQGYTQLELEALKQGNANLAKSSIANAKKHDAKKNAPKTFARAEEEMALAMTILDADRSQTAKADVHAKNAKWLAEQSSEISETIKDFDRRDYSMEDIVLWHQEKLSTINQPLGGQLAFNKPADSVVQNLTSAVSTLAAERNAALDQLNKNKQMSQSQLKAVEEKYGQKLAVTEKERLALLAKEQADQQKFDTVQAMFNPEEAHVYRQRQNVLISAQGFQFPSGQSEIQTANFPLMNKIIRAIKTFPNARVEVNGHTDSMGADLTNKKLSDDRAEKVAKFLSEVGEIDRKKITFIGFGETRPVATNETPAGRAENRRVEIKIINE